MSLRAGASLVALTLALGAGPGLAQTPAPQQKPAEAPKAPVAGQIVQQEADTLLAKELIGQPVYASDKSKIGNISDLILSKDAKSVNGFVIGVGGFLGIGEKSVALKMDRLKSARDPQAGTVTLTMDATKEELASAPAFKSMKEQESERQAAERARNQPTQPGGQPGRPTQQRPGN